MITKLHPFFMLTNSPWPLVSSLLSFNLFFSILLLFKFGHSDMFFLSVGLLTMCSFFWWMSYSSEFSLTGMDSFYLESGVKSAMLLFISSEVFFFFSFFWSYFHFLLAPTVELGMMWPPVGVEMFDFLNVPLINTLILLSSGGTVTLSHHYLLKSDFVKFNLYLMLTCLLGLAFSALQLAEYNSSFFGLSDSTFGTSFFMLTGFHGMHVLIGTVYLMVVLSRSFGFTSTMSSCLSFEMASWYWHFVDVVWIFLYFSVYYLNA